MSQELYILQLHSWETFCNCARGELVLAICITQIPDGVTVELGLHSIVNIKAQL